MKRAFATLFCLATTMLLAGICYFSVSFKAANQSIGRVEGPRRRLMPSMRSRAVFNDPVSVVSKRQDLEKPYLILHIGPGKTGTSTIQKELTDWQAVLAIDNYVYLGDFLVKDQKIPPVIRAFRNMKCHQELEKVRVSKRSDSSSSLGEDLSRVECWNQFLSLLEPYKQRRQSVILSHEGFSFRLFRFRDLGMSPMDWISIRESLRDDWNILVVIAYRRYAEWLPSAKGQGDLPLLNQKWPSNGGSHLEPMFPNYWSYPQHSSKQPWSFTDSAISWVKPHLPFVVLNFHEDTMSMRSNFICNAIPQARKSCRHSLMHEKKSTPIVVNRARPPRYYDMIVTRAADKGMIDTKRHSRTGAGELARVYHENMLKLSTDDFPVICPERNELELFLNMSVRLEERILPEFAASRKGEAIHRADYWNAVENGKFCSIDIEAVLGSSEWKRFFETGMDVSKTTEQ